MQNELNEGSLIFVKNSIESGVASIEWKLLFYAYRGNYHSVVLLILSSKYIVDKYNWNDSYWLQQ
jgi:hypothetical protein